MDEDPARFMTPAAVFQVLVTEQWLGDQHFMCLAKTPYGTEAKRREIIIAGIIPSGMGGKSTTPFRPPTKKRKEYHDFFVGFGD